MCQLDTKPESGGGGDELSKEVKKESPNLVENSSLPVGKLRIVTFNNILSLVA